MNSVIEKALSVIANSTSNEQLESARAWASTLLDGINNETTKIINQAIDSKKIELSLSTHQ
jgi:hypothetical protein